MRIILKILGAIGAVIVGLFVVAGLQAPEYRIERTKLLTAPPEKVFAAIGDITKWKSWSPWLEMEPTAEVNYSGPTQEAGATQTWKGQKIGSGSISFIEVEPNFRVKYRVEFIDWNSASTGEIRVNPANKPDGSPMDGGATQVTWVMEGKNNLIGRVFWVAMSMKKQIERDFDRGFELLENLTKN